MNFEFPNLPYKYNALEPHIDAKTMEIHHHKHHKAYYDKFTATIQGSDLESQKIEEILSNISKHSTAIRNNGGGYYNHNFFWNCLSPNGGNSPKGDLEEAINKKFNSYESFKDEWAQKATGRFGSGFVWLILNNKSKELEITSTPNQDNPLMDVTKDKGQPLLALDVWEHAYYLKYQNKRPEYISAFWNIINWDWVQKQYSSLS